MGRTDFLFASPDFLSGAARAFDLGGLLNECSYNISDTPGEADRRAIANDWAAVGEDLKRAMEEQGKDAKVAA